MLDDIVIRKAEMNEIDKVMAFLKENWGEHHVMANSHELMCYEHAWKDEFTFVLAEDSATNKIYGVLGYIPYSDEDDGDIGGGIWKVIQNPYFMLGTELLKFVQNHTKCRMFADCGANPKTKGHRKLAGHINATLNQYYKLNPLVKKFKVAVIHENKLPQKKNAYAYKLVKLENINQFMEKFDVSKFKSIMPYKDNKYIEHRYYRHIKYQYKIWGIENCGLIGAVVIGRDFSVNGTKVFRIIDFIGNESYLAGTFDAWEQFLIHGNYEYIDFYEYGLNSANLESAGFILRTDEDVNIIPNYFEPFEQRNIDIHISTNVSQGFRMFKGDGDQDRPNSL